MNDTNFLAVKDLITILNNLDQDLYVYIKTEAPTHKSTPLSYIHINEEDESVELTG